MDRVFVRNLNFAVTQKQIYAVLKAEAPSTTVTGVNILRLVVGLSDFLQDSDRQAAEAVEKDATSEGGEVDGYSKKHWRAELEKAKEAMDAWRCKRWLAKDALSKFKKSRSRSNRR
eukprot:s275_g25.t1